MGRYTLTELLHLMAGLVLTAAIFAAAEWAYPIGRTTIAWVGDATLLVVLLMGVGPLRRAWRSDHDEPRA